MSHLNYLNEECSICFDIIGSDDYLILPNCFHRFHLKCLSKWETKNNKNINIKENKFQLCPVCQYHYNETLLFKIVKVKPENTPLLTNTQELLKSRNIKPKKITKYKHHCGCRIS